MAPGARAGTRPLSGGRILAIPGWVREERLAVFLHVIADTGPAAGDLEVTPACGRRLRLGCVALSGLPGQRPFKQMRSRVGVVSWNALLRSQTAATPFGSGAATSSACTRLAATNAMTMAARSFVAVCMGRVLDGSIANLQRRGSIGPEGATACFPGTKTRVLPFDLDTVVQHEWRRHPSDAGALMAAHRRRASRSWRRGTFSSSSPPGDEFAPSSSIDIRRSIWFCILRAATGSG